MSDSTTDNKRLPEKLSRFLAEQPETGMDYQTGDVVLCDGEIDEYSTG